MHPDERLFTLGEAAKFFRLSLRTVRRLVDDGELPVVMLTRRAPPVCVQRILIGTSKERQSGFRR